MKSGHLQINMISGTGVVCFLCLFFFLGAASAANLLEPIETPSSVNPVGSGARALGMGGAFIAVADDATAASWNPGGLIQLESPEVSVVGAMFHRIEDNDFNTNPEASGRQTLSKDNLNYLSLAFPFALWDRNMIVSVNYQYLYDLNREWDFQLLQTSQTPPITSLNRQVGKIQSGHLSALGLAYCIQMTPGLSLGVTLNIWNDTLDDNGWELTSREQGTGSSQLGPFNYSYDRVDRYSFEGANVNLGMLWNINSHLTVGAVFKSPFTADLRHESDSFTALRFPNNPLLDSVDAAPVIETEDEKLDMPVSYGIGLAWRFSDAFTMSADLYRTEWGDYVRTDAAGNKTSPVTGKSTDESDIDATHQVRFGGEYLFIGRKYIVPIRAGIFYDPVPADGNPDDYFGFSLGSGVARGRCVFDMAYQYRFGRNVGSSMLQDFEFSQDVDEHTVYASLIIHF